MRGLSRHVHVHEHVYVFLVMSWNDDHDVVLLQELAVSRDDGVDEGELLRLKEQTGVDAREKVEIFEHRHLGRRASVCAVCALVLEASLKTAVRPSPRVRPECSVARSVFRFQHILTVGDAISTWRLIAHFSNTRFHPKVTAVATARVLLMVDSGCIGR